MRAAEAIQIPPVAMGGTFDGGVAISAKAKSWTLDELLSSADIRLDVQAETKREAIGHLADLLAGPAGAHKEDVTAALLRRERLGPTYIGDGLAMPHGRVQRSFIPKAAVLRLRHPVDFATMEEDAADVLVGVTWPEAASAGFVPTLANVWRLLRKAAVKKAVREARTAQELHGVFAVSGNA